VTKELSVAEAIEVIRSLPQQQAEAVMLRAVIGLDDVSASTVLGITASEVRTSAHQGLTELRHVLKRRERAT
jgi:RNA polymerase sigma-70 factor (ECF subfamily)